MNTHKLARDLLERPNGAITATLKGEEYVIENFQRVLTCANGDDGKTYWTLNLRDGGNGNIKR